MTLDLSGVALKISRAHRHLQELYGIQGEFQARRPYDVRIDQLTGTGLPLYRFVAVKTPQFADPPPDLAIVAGESLHQLRSSLNHLTYQLRALGERGLPKHEEKAPQFPICTSAEAFAKHVPSLAGIPASFLNLVERNQPYLYLPDQPKRDPLWLLQTLNNTDKHRLIPTVIVGVDVVTATEGDRVVFTVQSEDIELEDEKPFFTFTRATPVNARLACSPAFADAMNLYGATLSVAALVASIAVRVGKIVDECRDLAQQQ